MRSGWRKKEMLRKSVCLAIVGASVLYGTTAFAATNYDDGSTKGEYGRTIVVGVEEGTTYSKAGSVVTVSGTNVNLGSKALSQYGSTVTARVDLATTTSPGININATEALNVTSDYTAVSAQDGIINIGSSASRVNNVNLATTGTYIAEQGTRTLAGALSDEACATIFARNLFGAGEVNVWGNDVKITTSEATMTNIPDIKYGTAISGNGSGEVNIHSTGTTVIQGAIESLNTYLQSKGTTGIKVNINQDAADTGKVEMEGLFINAADKSEVNIKGASGSSIKTDLVASATLEAAGNGGKIKLELAGDSTFAGDVTAQNGGQITLNVGNAKVGTLTADGTNSAVNVTGGNLSATNYGTTNEGKLNITGGSLTATTAQLFKNAASNETTDAGNALVSGLIFSGNGSLVLTDEAAFTKDYLASMNKAYATAAAITLAKGSITGLVQDANGNVSATDLSGAGANLATVGVTTNGQNLVIGGSAGAEAGAVSTGDLGVKNINLGEATKADVKSGGTLTLIGSGTDALVATTSGTPVEVGVEGGTLNLGTAGVSGGGTIAGTVNANAGSTVNVAEGNFAVTTLNADGSTIEVGANGALVTENLGATNGSALTVNNGATVNTNTLTATGSKVDVVGDLHVSETAALGAGTNLNVGNSDTKGTFTAKEISLAEGANLFLDPSWTNSTPNAEGTAYDVNGASTAGVGTFGASGIAGNLAVGQN